MKQPIVWHFNLGNYLMGFLWAPWRACFWRWPHIEKLCAKGHGYAYSEWRYKIGPIDGKVRWGY